MVKAKYTRRRSVHIPAVCTSFKFAALSDVRTWSIRHNSLPTTTA